MKSMFLIGFAKVMGSPRLSSPELLEEEDRKTSVSPRRKALRNPHVHVSRNRPR